MANVITGIRMVCALGLLFCPIFSKWIYALYLLGGISDVLDGFVARHFGKETEFGARFDTVADIFFTVIVILKVVRTIKIPVWLLLWIGGIAVIKGINVIVGFLLHRRFVAEHTVLNKICGALLFAIPLCIGRFPWQAVTVLVILNCTIASFAAVQEGWFIRRGKEIR